MNRFKLFPFCILIASFGVLYLALPRFISSIYSAYPTFIQERIDTENFTLASEAYSDLYRSLTHANQWSESSVNWQLRAGLLSEDYFSKFDTLTNAEKETLLQQVDAAISSGLKLSPIDPEAWYQLARVRRAQHFSNEVIIKALEMSVLSQRMAPSLFIRRIALMLQFKAVLDESMYAMLFAQIRLAWQFRRNDLVALVAEHLDDKFIFNKAFINDPEQWQALEKLLEKYFKQHSKIPS